MIVAGRSLSVLVIAALAPVATPPARGQEPEREPVPLGEIVVSADRPVSELASTTRRVTAADIEAYGARTLDEAIALLPGIYLRTGSDGTPRVDLRGFRTRQVVLLLDGVPLNAASDGQFDPTLVPVEQIAEIKLATGTGSMLYGPGGLAGTINIITRSGGGRAQATARGEWRDGSAWLGRLTGSGGGRGIRAFGSASATWVDGFPAPAGSPTLGDTDSRLRSNSGRERLNLGGHLGADLGGRGRAGVTLQAVSGEQDVPPSVIDDPADPFASRPVYERVEELDGLSAQAAASYAPSRSWSVRGWAYRNLLNQLTSRYADAGLDPATLLVEPGTSRDRSRSLLSGGAVHAATTALPLGRLTLGFTADRARWEQSLLEAVAQGGGGSGGGGGGGGGGGEGGGGGGISLESASVNRAVWQYGPTLEYELRPAAGVGATTGVVYHRLEGEGLSDGAVGASLAAYGEPSASTRIRASYARRFRFPTLRQLFDAASGNPGLATEEADVYEVGFDYAVSARAGVGLTLFRADARDFIERPQGAPLFQNADRYRFQGLELEATLEPAAGLFTRARYTWLDAEDRTPGREGGRLQYRPRHVVNGEVRYATRSGLSAAGTVRYVADQVYESRRAPLVQEPLPDFALVGLRLSQRLGASPLGIYAGVDNLFDAAYEESYGFPQEGRIVYVGVDVGR